MTDPEIASRLQAILARPEFQPDALDPFWRKLSAWGRRAFRWLEQMTPEMRWAIGLAALTLLVLILFHLVRGYREAVGMSGPTQPAERSARETEGPDPAQLASLARRLAELGQLREGARALQQAVLVALCRQARLRWNSSAADWEWMSIFSLRPDLADFTRGAQALAFGPQPTAEAFEACWQRSRIWLEGAA